MSSAWSRLDTELSEVTGRKAGLDYAPDDILNGQDPCQDESMSLVVAARELYGSENWAFANGIPLVGEGPEVRNIL